MTILPHNQYVLCDKYDVVENDYGGIYVAENQKINLYKIIKLGNSRKLSNYSIGDVIMTNATGTHFKADNREYFLFDESTIVAKIDIANF